jgi:hypothetical protein
MLPSIVQTEQSIERIGKAPQQFLMPTPTYTMGKSLNTGASSRGHVGNSSFGGSPKMQNRSRALPNDFNTLDKLHVADEPALREIYGGSGFRG